MKLTADIPVKRASWHKNGNITNYERDVPENGHGHYKTAIGPSETDVPENGHGHYKTAIGPTETDLRENCCGQNETAKGQNENNPNGRKAVVDDVEVFVPPDGGWGWIVCFAALWANGTVFGVINTFGIIYVSMREQYAKNDPDISLKTGNCFHKRMQISA